MADEPTPVDRPHRHGNELFEDNHFHDDEEVALPPADDDAPSKPRLPPRPSRKLPPPKRRFHED